LFLNIHVTVLFHLYYVVSFCVYTHVVCQSRLPACETILAELLLQWSELVACDVLLFLFLGMIRTARYFLESIMTSNKCRVIARLLLWLHRKHRHSVWYWGPSADRVLQMFCRCSSYWFLHRIRYSN